jgi:hypothetical protein
MIIVLRFENLFNAYLSYGGKWFGYPGDLYGWSKVSAEEAVQDLQQKCMAFANAVTETDFAQFDVNKLDMPFVPPCGFNK